jgi:MOSC domain-containing protein YiiM
VAELRAESDAQEPFDAAAAEAALAGLSTAGRVLVALGAGAPRMTGTVAGVFRSDGGVPKQPTDCAEVGPRGLAGDRQADRKNHGRPWQALCLWSAEVVETLQSEGHPIAPGCAGENVSIRGVNWAALRPGTRLQLGSAVAELSVPALPCAKNRAWFRDGDVHRMSPERHPGESRWYASVLTPGTVRRDAAVTVEP